MHKLYVKSTIFTMLCIALLTAFFSEIKIMPFDDASFRFGLGSIVFFLAVLFTTVPIIWTGILTGVTVVLFRLMISVGYLHMPLHTSLNEHLPAIAFYILFALCLRFIPLVKLKQKPLLLGLLAALFETAANVAEHLVYIVWNGTNMLTYDTFILLLAVAFLRSFFVVGMYSVITLQEQRRQFARILNIHTELYVEALYLQKSMLQIEALTSDSFQLYKTLKPIHSEGSVEALRLSQEIHELKKDAARMYAGLSKIVQTEQNDLYSMEEILHYVLLANEKYSAHLQKNIAIHMHCTLALKTNQQFALLAILNNIISNAVEAIEHSGTITIDVEQIAHEAVFRITNDGPRIDEHALPIIFEAGYTSKFSTDGFAATGIGLSHVQAIVNRLEGHISVTSEQTTTFIIRIPLTQL